MAEDVFGERVAEVYDRDTAAEGLYDRSLLEPVVALLAELAGAEGRALELGVGTGRVALPLSQRGIEVHGIDLSPAMVDRLLAKPGADAVAVTIGDMATTRVGEGAFSLVYVVFNTILNLLTQDEQVACFANAAAHLRSGGCFVVEVIVPPLRRLPPGQTAVPFTVTDTYLGFDEIDVVTQRAVSHHHVVRGQQVDRYSMPFRYAWPCELDLMARLAGMGRRDRWADWHRTPFTADSTSHVSVWQRPA